MNGEFEMNGTTLVSADVTSGGDILDEDGKAKTTSALVWMQLLTGLVGILGNFLVCFAFLHRRTQRNQTNLLITNQAFIDLLSSILLVLHVLYDLAGRPETEFLLLRKFSCFFWRSQCILFACFAISTFNLTIISLERYCATVFPHSYLAVFSRRNLRVAIGVIWLLSPLMQYILTWTTYTFSEEGRCVVGWSPVWVGILLFLWEYFLPVTVMSFSFASITRKLRRMNRVLNETTSQFPSTVVSSVPISLAIVKTKNDAAVPSETSPSQSKIGKKSNFLSLPASLRNGTESSVRLSCRSDATLSPVPLPLPSPSPSPMASSSSPSTNVRVTVRRRNATKTLLTVYLVYIICWSPNQWAFFQLNLGGTLDFQSFFYKFSVIMVMLNTCVNPFVYALRHKTYKERVRELLRELKGKLSCTN